MTDNEKIIKGIDCCSSPAGCGYCPYFQTDDLNADCLHHLFRDVKKLLKEQPQIVRCKDCKKQGSYDCHITSLTGQTSSDDWFCADGEERTYDGERRTDDG